MENYNINLDLLKLQAAVMGIKSKDGNVKQCVVIPIEDNDLYTSVKEGGKTSVYLSLSAWQTSQVGKYGDSHYVKQYHSKKWREANPETQTAIIGNMKPIADFKKINAPVADVVMDENKDPFDLPF